MLVIGAGLAGLSCALHLARAGRDVAVVEASDGVGGRARTDFVDGFLLDRGFQVLQTAYPEARAQLDYPPLDLRSFVPGALIYRSKKLHRVSDPFRKPAGAFATLKAPIGSPLDKVRVARLRRRGVRQSIDDLWQRPERATIDELKSLRFSDKMVDSFFRPLFGGVFLEAELTTSSRMFDFVWKMLAIGDCAVPARGMQAIADQLASGLPPGTVRLASRVGSVSARGQSQVATLVDTTELRCRHIVVATEGPQAARLLGAAGTVRDPGSIGVTCMYYAADRAPMSDPVLVLNGEGRVNGPVNNVAVMSNASRSYAPDGRHLVSVTLLGAPARGNDPGARAANESELDQQVRAQLTSWFGGEVKRWDLLRSYRIAHALPLQAPPALDPHERNVRLGAGVYVCGDHRDQASIQGALTSGRRAAEAVIADT